ncbi:Hypothetical protein (Fragment) [Durusdinium trenchii]|uniref:Uncharacterized protein n=1 Tax=Durusdinium trenchii TaxID=1381693 RepID=A0ABP0HEU8_9DINO
MAGPETSWGRSRDLADRPAPGQDSNIGDNSCGSNRLRRRVGRSVFAVTLTATATLLPNHEAFDAVESQPDGARSVFATGPLGGWRLCAREGGSCNCVGTVALHSWLADWSMLRHVNGSIPCSVAFFGHDPRPHLPKLCSCLASLSWPESLVDGLNETISRSLLPRVEAGPAEATCSPEDDGKWTPCSVLSSRHDGSVVPDRILPRLPVEEQRDMALRKLDLCHRLAPDQALRILGVWPSNIQMGVVPIKASSAPLCAVVYSPLRGALWDGRAAIFCPTEPPKCLEGSCECADASLSRIDLRKRRNGDGKEPKWSVHRASWKEPVGPACHRERLQKMKSPDKMPETQKFAAPCADQNRETTNKHKQLDSAVASSCFLKYSAAGPATLPDLSSFQPSGETPAKAIYADAPQAPEKLDALLRQALGEAFADAPRTALARAGMLHKHPEVIRMAVALAHSGLGVEIQQLRAEHVPAAQIGLRIEADGKQVPLDSGELRDFRRPPHSVEERISAPHGAL